MDSASLYCTLKNAMRCVGKDNSMEQPSQRHDFLIAPRCLFGRSFSPLQYHADETAVSSLIHCSTKAMVLQYHLVWYRRGTGKDLRWDAVTCDWASAEPNLFNLVHNGACALSNEFRKTGFKLHRFCHSPFYLHNYSKLREAFRQKILFLQKNLLLLHLRSYE